MKTKKLQKGILFFILMVLFMGIFINPHKLNSYSIAPSLLILLLWWSGNKMTKLGLRISFTILSFVLLFLCFFPDLLYLARLETLKHRIFDMFGSGIIIGSIVLVILSTIGLFLINPENKFKPSVTLVYNTGKLSIIFTWLYILFIIIEQSFFITRHNVSSAAFYTWIGENHLFWWRDFVYGKVHYLLKLIATALEFFFFSFITIGLTFTQLYRKINLYPYGLKPIVIACFGLLFISLTDNIILRYILGISINIIYFILLNGLFHTAEQWVLNSRKSIIIKYPNRKVIKLWVISTILSQLLDFIYYIGPFSYSNIYIATKLTLYLLAALFLTISIIKFSRNIQMTLTNCE